ncbi:MAG: hypothetical protein WCG42_09565 [Parachlamydiaceae bacterium]
MIKFVFGLFFNLFLFQANCNGVDNVKNQKVSADFAEVINQFSTQVQETFAKRYNAEVLAGDFGMLTWATKPTLEFEIVGPFTKKELRVILIESIEQLLVLINSNEKLRPFLKKYPYSPNEITIGISIVDKNKNTIYYPDIFSASFDRDKLYFHTLDKKNEYEYKTTEIEEYQTALKIVRDNIIN